MTLAQQIRHYRLKQGWTQVELGKAANIAQPVIARYESGRYDRYSLATLRRLAEALDVRLVVRFSK